MAGYVGGVVGPVVVSTPDVVGERMAGPGIRAWHFAEELAKHFPTTLVAKLEGSAPPPAPFPILARRSPDANAAIRNARVLVAQSARRFIPRRGQRVIFDLFDPIVLELRELYGAAPSPRQRLHVAAEWWRLMVALRFGDLLIAATPKQREFYRSVQSTDAPWIEVPFGVESDPVATKATKENLVLWNGGVWEWLDPSIAVDAVTQLNREGVEAKLLFLGRARPNSELVDRRRDDRFEELLARGAPYVEANSEWVPYRDRLSWLRRAKIAIMLHRPTREAVYSIRTRLFDAIASGTPVIATEEGFAAELVAREGLGIVVPPSDAGAVARAMRRLLCDDTFHGQCVTNLGRIRPQFSWPSVTRPLVDAIRDMNE